MTINYPKKKRFIAQLPISMSSTPGDIIGNFTTFVGLPLDTLNVHTFARVFECINLLQNDFCIQRYITLNATVSGQDRIYPKTHLCRTFFAEYSKPMVQPSSSIRRSVVVVVHNAQRSSPKPLDKSKPNCMWRLLG